MIRDDQVDQVRDQADIVGIIGEVVQLKKAGREFTGLCPFHEEKSPSFYVNPAKGVYNCFGCGESGDAIDFVRKRQGLDFVEAVKYVGARSGIAVEEVKSPRDQEEDPFKPYYEANAFAQKWLRDNLLDPRVGKEAREYLADRGIDEATQERFGLGWAPDEWRGLIEAADRVGIDAALLMEVGLATTSERTPEPYDRFRGRVTFPIEAVGGRIVGFGGRIIGKGGPGQPKYLNSPETAIYHKGRTLYGLNRSRHAIRREDAALMVEGYMDVVALSAAGFENAVAALGTAMTPEQAKLIHRYTDRVLLLYDSDRAGMKATFKAGDILLAEGVYPLVVTLPGGEDPDTLVRGEGPEALQRYLDQAVDILDRKIQILEERDYFAKLDRKQEAVDRLLPTLRAVKDPIRRDMYIGVVAEKAGLTRETLERDLERAAREVRAQALHPPRAHRSPPRVPPPRRPAGETLGPAWEVLRVLARDRNRREEFLEGAVERVGPEDFKDPAHRAIFQAFLDDPELQVPPAGMEERAARKLEGLLAAPPDDGQFDHGPQALKAALDRLVRQRLEARQDDLQRQIEASSDENEKLELIRRKRELKMEMNALGRGTGGEHARRLARGYHNPETPQT
jgi:DNA primase